MKVRAGREESYAHYLLLSSSGRAAKRTNWSLLWCGHLLTRSGAATSVFHVSHQKTITWWWLPVTKDLSRFEPVTQRGKVFEFSLLLGLTVCDHFTVRKELHSSDSTDFIHQIFLCVCYTNISCIRNAKMFYTSSW